MRTGKPATLFCALFFLFVMPAWSQDTTILLNIFNAAVDPMLKMGPNNNEFYLQQYSLANKFLQESMYDGSTYHVISEKYKTHTYFKNYFGIGQPMPVTMLDVNGSIRANSALVMFGPGSQIPGSFDLSASGKRGIYIDNAASTTWDFLTMVNNNGTQFKVKERGYTGIGVDPEYRLHIKQQHNGWTEGIGITNTNITWTIMSDDYGGRLMIAPNQDISKGILINDGSVGIGMNGLPEYKMAVNGTVGARKIKVVASNAPGWPDFVFEPDYQLQPLAEVERYVQRNRHLPGIPTAEDVKKDGVDLGEMNMKLLQKIEELTLHLIEQNKEMNRMKQEMAAMKAAIAKPQR